MTAVQIFEKLKMFKIKPPRRFAAAAGGPSGPQEPAAIEFIVSSDPVGGGVEDRRRVLQRYRNQDGFIS